MSWLYSHSPDKLMCVLANDPFYQTPSMVFGLTHREVWEWIVEGPYEQARKDAGRPSVEEAGDPDFEASNVAKLIGPEKAELVAAAIRESRGEK